MDAASVILAVRDWSTAFRREGPGGTPDPVLFRRIGRLQEELFARVLKLNPDALAVTAPEVVTHVEVLAALTAKAPHAVPAFLTPIRAEFRLTDEGYTTPVAFASIQQATNRGCPFPAVVPLVDVGLRFVDLRDFGASYHGWETEGQLEFFYVPRPTAPASLGATLDAPDWMRPKLEAELALWMFGRLNMQVPSALAESARAAEASFADAAFAQQAGTSWYVHEGG